MKNLFSIILIAAIFVTCGEDGEKIIPTEIPALPVESTFSMDFSITDANSGGRTGAKEVGNWARSTVIVTVWSALAGIYTAIPVASFKEAFNHEPTFDASIRGWVWEYDFTLQASYRARLESEITASGVNWKMYISQEDSFQDFNWYSGFSDISGISGTWTLNTNPQDPKPALEIIWNRNEDGTTKDLTYTNVIPDDVNNGGFIKYETSSETEYNRYYEIFQKKEDNTITIEWHKENHNGRVKDPAHYQDQNFHCWDESLTDKEC